MIEKMLKHLKYTPVALLLAFVAAGAPSAPVGDAVLFDGGVAFASIGGRDCSLPPPRDDERSAYQRDCDPYEAGPLALAAAALAWLGRAAVAAGRFLSRALSEAAKVVGITVGVVHLHGQGFFAWLGERWNNTWDDSEALAREIRNYCAENPLGCVAGDPRNPQPDLTPP